MTVSSGCCDRHMSAEHPHLYTERPIFQAARCTIERLMRRMGWSGAVGGKSVRTTVPDPKQPCPLDRVNRQFKADRPNQLWVSDFTYGSTWQGWLYEPPRV